MPKLDIAAELERVSRLTRLLEPLAVLYEKAILDARKQPHEINLRVQRSVVYSADNYGVAETVHFIEGVTLQAVYEVWQEYRQIERDLLDQSNLKKALRPGVAWRFVRTDMRGCFYRRCIFSLRGTCQ